MASYTEGPGRALVILNCEDLEATKPGFYFEAYKVCVKCHLTWRESEMAVYNGKTYGIPCGCSRDIPKLMGKGRA